MAVKVRCDQCSALFHVDDAFAGARCRCKYCGGITCVPRDAAATPDLPRPQKPTTKSPRVRPVGTPSLRAWMRANKGRVALWSLVGIMMLAVAGWQFAILRPADLIEQPIRVDVPVAIDLTQVARVPPDATLKRLPRAFLDTSLDKAATVGWLIDGCANMRPFYGDVTTLVATTMARLDPQSQKVGLCLAALSKTDVVPLTAAGGDAVRAARQKMRSLELEGMPDLLPAFAELCSWRPDSMFIVLARPATDAAMMSAMSRKAQEFGLKVNVVTIGNERVYQWTNLAADTRGVYRGLQPVDLKLAVAELFSPVLGALDAESPGSLAADLPGESENAGDLSSRTRLSGDLRVGSSTRQP